MKVNFPIKITGVLKALLDAVNDEFKELNRLRVEMQNNIFTESTKLLDKWEEELKLKHYPYLTNEQRKQRIIAHNKYMETMSDFNLENFLRSLGFDIRINKFAFGEDPRTSQIIGFPTIMDFETKMSMDTVMALPLGEILANGFIQYTRRLYNTQMGTITYMGHELKMGDSQGYINVIEKESKISNNPRHWPYYYVISGENDDYAKIESQRKEEFRRVVLQNQGAELTAILLVEYV